MNRIVDTINNLSQKFATDLIQAIANASVDDFRKLVEETRVVKIHQQGGMYTAKVDGVTHVYSRRRDLVRYLTNKGVAVAA